MRSQGYTLIELIAVITISVILGALTWSTWVNPNLRDQLSSERSRIQYIFTTASRTAFMKNMCTTLTFSKAVNWRATIQSWGASAANCSAPFSDPQGDSMVVELDVETDLTEFTVDGSNVGLQLVFGTSGGTMAASMKPTSMTFTIGGSQSTWTVLALLGQAYEN